MQILYQSPSYKESNVYGVLARKISDNTLRVVESDISFKIIRKYDIDASYLIATKEFDDDLLHTLTVSQINIVNRIVTIDRLLTEL